MLRLDQRGGGVDLDGGQSASSLAELILDLGRRLMNETLCLAEIRRAEGVLDLAFADDLYEVHRDFGAEVISVPTVV